MTSPAFLGALMAAPTFLIISATDDPGSGVWLAVGDTFGPGGQMIVLWVFFVAVARTIYWARDLG